MNPQNTDKKRPKIDFFFDLDRNISESHMTIKRLTKFDFSHVSSIFNPFWSVYVDMENPYKNEIWVQKSFFSTIFGFSVEYSTGVEISTWKLFLWKVHIIGYIFHIHHMCSKCMLMKLRAFEVTRKIIIFADNYLKNGYLRVHGIYSNNPLFFKKIFWSRRRGFY